MKRHTKINIKTSPGQVNEVVYMTMTLWLLLSKLGGKVAFSQEEIMDVPNDYQITGEIDPATGHRTLTATTMSELNKN